MIHTSESMIHVSKYETKVRQSYFSQLIYKLIRIFENFNFYFFKEFMIFRFKPLKITDDVYSDWSQPIGDKLISQVIQNQFKSVMKTDYVNNVEEKGYPWLL